MARTKPAERKRARILDKEEIRDVWIALDRLALGQDAPSCYPAFIRTLLLTGLRRSEAAKGHVEELKDEGWIIPAARMKSKRAHLLPLTESVRALLGKKGFLFSSDGGKTPFSGYSKSKAALDRKIAELRKADSRKPIPDWVLHDLRRTARSLLSRFTTPDVAERVIGHAIPGVRGHYDFHEYAEEKRAALERLGAYIEDIIYPDKAVVAFPKRRRGSKM
jgi:integrase